MFGGFFKKKDDKPGEKVILHVYELGEGQQPQLPFGMGLYHSGVEVWRQEYSFGGGPTNGTGVFAITPKSAPGCRYKESVVIGETKLTYSEFQQLLDKMKQEYAASSYHLTGRNCNHFAADLCKRLCGKSIPGYVNRAASIGHVFSGLFGTPQMQTPAAPEAASAKPSFVAFQGTGQTVKGKVVDEKRKSSIAGPKEEAADVRRQRMLEAAMKRSQAPTEAP